MMRRRYVFAAMVAAAMTMMLSGYATKLRMTAKQMCEAHGGTYSAQAQQCDYTAQRRTAKQNCEAHGGVYWPEQQYCEIETGR